MLDTLSVRGFMAHGLRCTSYNDPTMLYNHAVLDCCTACAVPGWGHGEATKEAMSTTPLYLFEQIISTVRVYACLLQVCMLSNKY